MSPSHEALGCEFVPVPDSEKPLRPPCRQQLGKLWEQTEKGMIKYGALNENGPHILIADGIIGSVALLEEVCY